MLGVGADELRHDAGPIPVYSSLGLDFLFLVASSAADSEVKRNSKKYVQ
jgi:hypothetical protein